jgi:hypothetical protein
MAAGFDWQANYVTQVSPDETAAPGSVGKSKVDVFAWMTLANGGNQSFLNANTMAIAGRPNRESNDEPPRATGEALTLRCWPAQRTHEVPFRPQQQFPWRSPGADYGYLDERYEGGEDIMVTGSRMKREMLQESPMAISAYSVAALEDLGDLKLYRIPEPVTVNAKGQKQVAMIVKPDAKFDRLYHADVRNYEYAEENQSWPIDIMLRAENKKEKGLGLPLPSGQAMVFEQSPYGPLLAGETSLSDRAIGDKVELVVGQSPDVRIKVVETGRRKNGDEFTVTISNARSEPVNVEVVIPYELRQRVKAVSRIDGVPTWKGLVPANGEVIFTYRLKLER